MPFEWECMGHFYDSIKIAVFKTLRRLAQHKLCSKYHQGLYIKLIVCVYTKLVKIKVLYDSLYQSVFPVAGILSVKSSRSPNADGKPRI